MKKIAYPGLFLFFIFFPFVSVDAQTATCSTMPGGLCYGISNSAECSTTLLTDCNSYPRCAYSGVISGYYCKNNCYNTGQAGSCGTGRVCLCVNQNRCTLCTFTGIDLNACNNNGCGGADTERPVVNITSPTANPTYTTAVSPISISGTASDNSTLRNITWSNNRNDGFLGGSGTASGTSSWNIGFINLEPGSNIITVTATDGTGNTGTDVLTVTYNPPANPGTPSISITENTSSYAVTITDPDPMAQVAYAWGEKVNVYFLLPFANEDSVSLSSEEQARYSYLTSNLHNDWDRLTQNKHPLKFNFIPPFKVNNYSKNENSFQSYITKSIDNFKTDNPGVPNYPAIYVFLYPEPYFDSSFTNMFGSEEKQVIAEVYLAQFNDTSLINYPNANEILSNVVMHELAHDFSQLPNDVNIPPGDSKYFWLSHPAGFIGEPSACSNTTDLIDCPPYGASESPTGTEGYYEAYSILSLARPFISKNNFGNRDPELSPLVEMAMGIRSRYENAPYIFHEGYKSGSGTDTRFNFVAAHDYGISSRWLFDYSKDQTIFHQLYWSISYDNTKTTLSNATKSFSVSKTGQSGRPLIIYAGDALNPGYFKVFPNNVSSEKISSDNTAPNPPGGVSVR